MAILKFIPALYENFFLTKHKSLVLIVINSRYAFELILNLALKVWASILKDHWKDRTCIEFLLALESFLCLS